MPLSRPTSNVPSSPHPLLRFHILQGRNLASKDMNGFSDPYVTIKINKLKAKTKCIKKTLNPDWYEIIELAPNFEAVPTVVQLTCWDKDTMSKDFMGEIKINLLSLFDEFGNPKLFDDNPSCAHWVDLQKRAETDIISGQIRLSYGFYISHESHYQVLKSYYDSLALSRSIENISLNISETQLTNVSNHSLSDADNTINGTSIGDMNGLLYIDVVSASDLPWDKNSTGTTFDMDPFVVVTLGDTTFKTSTIKHNLNPEWNERIVFQLQPDLHSFSVKFSLYDYDKFSNNDFIGSASVPIGNVLAASKVNMASSNLKRGTVFPLPLVLRSSFPKERFMSQLLIRAEYVPYAQVRRDFWTALATSFDADENGNMNRTEILTMLESLDGNFQEDVVESFFSKFNKSSEVDELTFAELSDCLEEATNNGEVGTSSSISISDCPICHKKLDANNDSISHIAICSSMDPRKINRIVMGNFITEANAQRKWFTKIASFVGYGEYKVGENNANILVQDRGSGEIFEEKMPTYIKLGIRLLYRVSKTTAENSRIKKVLYTMSVNQGKKYTDPNSVREIEPFIKFHNLIREEILDPLDSFANFNEFFFRKLRADARSLASPDPRVAVSPADSRVMVFPTISNAQELWIKGEKFTIAGLFNNQILPEEVAPYEEGSLAIFRLAPQDYHRFHIPVDGILSPPTDVDGQYYTVNPMAIRSSLDVYGENKRCFSFINSDHHGKVAMICVGAMMVGSIVLTSKPEERVARLNEHGYFAFGGSTILVLFQKGTIQFDADLLKNSSKKLETLLKVGNSIGISPL